MEDVGLYCGHLVYFTDTRYILWPFGVFCVNLVYFVRLNLATLAERRKTGFDSYWLISVIRFGSASIGRLHASNRLIYEGSRKSLHSKSLKQVGIC
jgi:hypothetical protein